jgi:hypothetical protein
MNKAAAECGRQGMDTNLVPICFLERKFARH